MCEHRKGWKDKMTPNMHGILKTLNIHEALNVRDTKCSPGIKYTWGV